jgi:hypothetical protein
MLDRILDGKEKEMEELEPGIYHGSHDNYVFTVAKPKYVTADGNFAVSTVDNKYSLLIWPSAFGGAEYGVSIYVDEYESYSIMVTEKIKPVDANDQEVVDEHIDQLKPLFERARMKWNL